MDLFLSWLSGDFQNNNYPLYYLCCRIPLIFFGELKHFAKSSSAMKILLKLRTHKALWIPKSYCRPFHKDHKLLASEIFSHYEPSKRHEQEAPEYFNFASDVLDKWSQMEKVESLLLCKLDFFFLFE